MTFTALCYRAVVSVLRRATARPEHVYHWHGVAIPVPNSSLGPTEREERARWEQAADHCPKA